MSDCSLDITLQKDTQEGTPPLTQSQEPLKPQENISRPIHHPLVLKTNFEEEEEEVNEQNDASSLWTKTPEEIEEKRAIKEMCYKSGEYYRVHTPPDISSSKSTASTPEKELEKPLENGSELQEGGDCYIPQRIIFLGVDEKKEKEVTMSKCSNTKDNKDSPHPKRSLATRLAPTAHVLNATENISLKCREDPSSTLQTPNPKNKTSYHRSNKDRNAENASYIHVQRDTVRTVSLNAPPCSRPTHGFYNKVINICQHHIMVQLGEKEFLFQKHIQKLKRYIQSQEEMGASKPVG
ncbi:Hypothetical protein D623_10012207 [Myotis brandtii]|uniref:Uncharacterized protein n=1 Tax=Myotis brandtii TaxID=109478 RepID=S7N365_MYOBR|nr:Hypothetical protein D623_10012207 [Myotis brandtii]